MTSRLGIAASALALGLGLVSCSSSTMTGLATQSLMSQMGGASSMTTLASSFLGSSMKDPLLSGLMGEANTATVTPQLSDQLCSILGGGCTPPLTQDQIEAGADELTPAQANAVNNNFASSLGGMGLSSALRSSVTNAIGPSLPGIIGALF